MRRRRARLMRAALWGGLAVLGLLLADYALYPRWAGPGGQSANTGRNGLWLRYRWYFGERSDAELDRLAEDLQAREITYAYFHVRHITESGRLEYRKPDTGRRLTDRLRRTAPGVRLIAWIYAGNARGAGDVQIADPGVRQAMTAEALWLMEECGFDGVQWDYEICPNDDPDLPALLRETRELLPSGAHLSVAAPACAAWPFTHRWGWSEDYFQLVAAECDQVAVMCYDTGLFLPRAYVWLVRQQATKVTRSVARGNPNCGVVLGIPAYGPPYPDHHPRAESIGMALKGVREGLADPSADMSVFDGVAPFADYTMDADEWRTYESLWLAE